jgi:hypothetical protein
MKSRQQWITAGTAVVSFALGAVLAPTLRKSVNISASESQVTRSSARPPSESQADNPKEGTPRPRLGNREEKKKNTEPRISIPLASVAKVIREQRYSSHFSRLDYQMARALPLLGATEQETSDIKTLLKQAESDIYAAEKTHLKAIQTDASQIQLDNSSMKSVSKVIAQKTQDGIRSSLPPDLAEVLISSVDWNEIYPTDEKSYPTLTITRSTSGKMTVWIRDSDSGTGYPIDPKFADDGTAIPADEALPDDRWRPFLKGLTLLPQNEK